VILPRRFYERPTLDVARDLLGKVLVHERRGVRTSGAIVEVEAYIGEDDPACHAAPGPTRRNTPMYGEPGHAYVYLNYGIHWMMNIVTEAKGSPAAVLIRALAPIDGLEAMRRRRGVAAVDDELCRGPGNLTGRCGSLSPRMPPTSSGPSLPRRSPPRHRRGCVGPAHRD
jgi:DNA-3-methyladenine glycosylase